MKVRITFDLEESQKLELINFIKESWLNSLDDLKSQIHFTSSGLKEITEIDMEAIYTIDKIEFSETDFKKVYER